jgi:ABC-type dipeptide/oligopeptide/nickel transport system permease subunit
MRSFPDTLVTIIKKSDLNINQISMISGISNTYLTKLLRHRINHPGKDKIASVLFPGLTLILLVVAINLFSDWLRDEMNPRLALRS